MSKISLKPNASGTGVFSLEAPNSNVDRTLDLPDEAGTVLTNVSDIESQVKTATNATGTAPVYACRAWVNFNGTGTVSIRESGNVSSITDNGTGNYTVNFATAMPDGNYSLVGIAGSDGDQNDVHPVGIDDSVTAPTTSSSRIQVATRGFVATDQKRVSVNIFR
jgi:hypothetical protein